MRRKVIRSREGKTLEVVLETEGGRIGKIVISGDFMAFPSSAIDELEAALIGKKPEDVEEVVREALSEVELLGVSWEEIAGVIKELLSFH